MKPMNIFWIVIFMLWVLMVSAVFADEATRSSYAKIERIVEYRTTGDSGPTITVWEPNIFGVGAWRTYKVDESGLDIELFRPHTVITLRVQADGTEVRAVTMLGFASVYSVDEVIQVVKTKDGQWLPIFEKLKELYKK